MFAPNGADISSSRRSGRRKPAIPLPEDWEPDVAYARSKGLTDSQINHQGNKLVDWAKANDKRYVDWDAVWRNWVRNFVERQDGTRFH